MPKKASKKKVSAAVGTAGTEIDENATTPNLAPNAAAESSSPSFASSESSSTPSTSSTAILVPNIAPAAAPSTASATTATTTATATTTTAAEVKFCKVAECRFASSHVTSAHQCGKCGVFAHGVIECDDQAARDSLIPFTGDRLPPSLQCTLLGCRFRHSHTNSAHQCGKCNLRGHSAMACPSHLLAAPIAAASFSTASTAAPSPSSFSASSTSLGFIGGSGFGTGGGVSSHLFSASAALAAKSKKGHVADATISFLCPMCRVPNTVRTSQPNVYNVEVDCVVCNDAKAQVFNPQCGHVCLCWACAKDLK